MPDSCGCPLPPGCLDGPDQDRYRNQCLDELRRHAYTVQRRECERDRVTECERGHEQDESFDGGGFVAHRQHSDEEDMIVTGDIRNVIEAEAKVERELRHRGAGRTTVSVTLDGVARPRCTLFFATTPMVSSKFDPPVFKLRSKRGKLLLDTSIRMR